MINHVLSEDLVDSIISKFGENIPKLNLSNNGNYDT